LENDVNRRGIRYPAKRILVLDELTLVAAFFVTLFVRYREMFKIWTSFYDGLYVSFLIVLCLIQALIFIGYDKKKKSIFEMDPVENLMSVVKSKVILIVLGLLYLYATQRGEQSSRFVVAGVLVLSIIFGFVARMICRKSYLKNHDLSAEYKTLEVTSDEDAAEVIAKYHQGSYNDVLVHVVSEGYDNLLRKLDREGIRTFIGTTALDYQIRSGIISDINGYASIPASVRSERFNLFGINYAVSRTEEAVLHVMRHIKELSGEYICFSNVHTSVMAREDASYRDVLNGAAFVFPDGTPIATLEQKKGYVGAERVAGPDFMEHMFRDTQDGRLSHFFYGASQETLDALKENLLKKYPGIDIRGMYSPPFRALSEEEDRADVNLINGSGADIIWIGLGAPKQEKWMNAHKGEISGVMMGVGAGFDFHAGTIKRAPKWIQKIGLEWLFRLFQDPGRLFKRYFVTNGKFIWYLLTNRK
jgi:exopolysaccharide biosynthesis WecB/TagA/CpsF family protein